jgi:LysM repeat protein
MSILDQSASVASSVIDPIAALIKNPFSTTVPNGGLRPNDFTGGFQIIEYIKGVPNFDTIIRLVGNMMPMQPFPWSGEQRLAKEYYAGNPEPAVQVLGPKEGPLVIKGRFKDKRYKDPSYYGVSYQMSKACDEVRKRGNLLKFGMHGTTDNWFRFGFLEKVDFKMNKLSWIDYELEFFVVSEKQPINNYFAAPEKQSPSSINQNLINSAQTFAQNYGTVPSTVPQSIAGVMNGLISSVAKNVNLVTHFVSTTLATGQDIANSAQRALGLIANARSQISIFNRKFNKLSNSFSGFSKDNPQFTAANFFSGLQTPGPASLATSTFQNISYSHETMSATSQLSSYLAQMKTMFEALAKTVPMARYRVQTGDTLQNISIKFYKTSSHWTDIYDHNHLQSSLLVPGKILEIPNLEGS